MAIQIVNCNLKNLTFENVKFYSNLKSLWLPLNHIQSLRNGVFANNLKLEKVSLYGNQLKVIESNVLTVLKNLKFASFERNRCVDRMANETASFVNLQHNIEWFCSGK